MTILSPAPNATASTICEMGRAPVEGYIELPKGMIYSSHLGADALLIIL